MRHGRWPRRQVRWFFFFLFCVLGVNKLQCDTEQYHAQDSYEVYLAQSMQEIEALQE